MNTYKDRAEQIREAMGYPSQPKKQVKSKDDKKTYPAGGGVVKR